jgi:hypothetical protein
MWQGLMALKSAKITMHCYILIFRKSNRPKILNRVFSGNFIENVKCSSKLTVWDRATGTIRTRVTGPDDCDS